MVFLLCVCYAFVHICLLLPCDYLLGKGCHTALHFGVKAKENQDKVPTLYWLPKLHKNL